MDKSNRKNRNKGRKRNPWNVLHELATFIPPHEPVRVDVWAANAGDTPRIEGNFTLAIGYRFMEDRYESFAHKRLTQPFLDRVYRLARFALEEGLEYLELDDRIEWKVSTGLRQPQRLRIASDHFYWTAMLYELGIELSTAPVLFSDLEEQLLHVASGGSGVLSIAIDDPDDQADVLAELTSGTREAPVLPIPLPNHL